MRRQPACHIPARSLQVGNSVTGRTNGGRAITIGTRFHPPQSSSFARMDAGTRRVRICAQPCLSAADDRGSEIVACACCIPTTPSKRDHISRLTTAPLLQSAFDRTSTPLIIPNLYYTLPHFHAANPLRRQREKRALIIRKQLARSRLVLLKKGGGVRMCVYVCSSQGRP